MKKIIPFIAVLCFGGILASETALADVITNTSSVQLAQSSFSNFNIQKFDSNLGTLTGVRVTVDFATLQGAFEVVNNDVTTASISDYSSLFSIKGVGSLGYTAQNNVTFDPVQTSPDWNIISIAGGGSQTFTIVSGQDFTSLLPSATQTIASGYFSAYESVGGSGTVTFQAKNSQSITTTGSSYTLNSGTSGANTQISVIYTYTAIPEPSTYALMGLGALALVVAYGRKRAA